MCTAIGAYTLDLASDNPKLTRGWQVAPTDQLEELTRELEKLADVAMRRADRLADMAERTLAELAARETAEGDPAYRAAMQDRQDADASLQDRYGEMPSYAS